MAYNYGKIEAPVSVYDVQQCCWVRLQRTVSGQTQTRYSGDVGVLCCAQVGDTIPASDGLGSWTVVARGTVNMWSPRKPIYSPKVVQLTNQYWQEVVPEVVHEDKKGYLTMQYDVLAMLSTISVAKNVVNHEQRIKELEKENANLRDEINELKKVA